MEYREYLPSPPLRRYVKCFWTLSSHGRPAPADTGTVMPDGSLELVLNFGGAIRRRRGGEVYGERLWRMAVGQMDRLHHVEFTGTADILVVRFRAAGAYAFFGIPQHELSGQVVALDAFAGRLDRQLASEVDGDWPVARRCAAVERLLLAHLGRMKAGDELVERAVARLSAAHGLLSLSMIMAETGLSARQVERRFQRAVGLNPKLLCRILRFQRVWEAATEPGPKDWAALALDGGYYDQAHLIRDFAQFSGMTPAEASRRLGDAEAASA
jgi:methylphosphotriester-DNA--protein-cysteine methyltransferase